MKLDKKQLPQLVALGVLLIACIGFVAFQLSSGNSVPPAPLKKAGVGSEAKATQESQTANPAQQIDPLTGTAVSMTRRDPFQPVKLPIDPTSIVVEEQQPQPRHTEHSNRTPAFPRDNSRVPGINTAVGPFNPFNSGGNTPNIVKPIVVEEKDPEFALTGIVRGEENVAIVRVGTSGRYVVKQGQLIEGRYRVVGVTPDSVTLAYKGRRIEIKLGGVKNAS